MVARELVAHFVGYVVDIESIAHGVGRTRYAAGLATGPAHHAQAGYPTAARAHHVADVVVGRANDAVNIALVLFQQGNTVGVGENRRRLGARAAQENQLVVVGHEHQAHGQFFFVHAHHAVHGSNLAGHYAGHGVAFGEGILGGVGQSQAVGAQLGAAGPLARSCTAQGSGHTRSVVLPLRNSGGKPAVEGRAGGSPVHVFVVEAEVVPGVGPTHGVNVKAIAAAGEHLGVKALGRKVEAHGGGSVVEANAGVGLYAGEASGQGRGHNGGLMQGKTARAAVGQGQRQH